MVHSRDPVKKAIKFGFHKPIAILVENSKRLMWIKCYYLSLESGKRMTMPQEVIVLGRTFQKQIDLFVCWAIPLLVVVWNDRVCLEDMSRLYSLRTQERCDLYDNIAYKTWGFRVDGSYILWGSEYEDVTTTYSSPDIIKWSNEGG